MARLVVSIVMMLLLAAPALAGGELTALTLDAMARAGIDAYHKRDYQTAIRYLEHRSRQNPQDPNVIYYLGNCYLQTQQRDSASKMFAHCVRIAPASQAGKYSLQALEALSGKVEQPPPEEKVSAPDPKAVAAQKDALLNEAAIDKQYNDAVRNIANHRQTFKARITSLYQRLTDQLSSMTPKNTPNYGLEMEKLRGEAENEVEELQLKELRAENRMLAPTKIDVRSVPEKPVEKKDNAKSALGTNLLTNLTNEKPFDPFGPEVSPEIAAKFLSIKDVFGELSTYEPTTRSVVKQLFIRLKQDVENKQNSLDQETSYVRKQLIHEIFNIKVSYGSSYKTQMTSAYHLNSTAIPRRDSSQQTQMEQDLARATERALRRIKSSQELYDRDVASIIAGSKESLHSMITQASGINSQLKNMHGSTLMMPIGSSIYNKNYVHLENQRPLNNDYPEVPLKAVPLKIQTKKGTTPTSK
jgi:hypothetical protein